MKAKEIKKYQPKYSKNTAMKVAINVAIGILNQNSSGHFPDNTTRKMLRFHVIVPITEAEGKWNLPYISKAAIENPEHNVIHEHVHTAKSIISRLLDCQIDESAIRSILSDCTACIVTEDEHKLLKDYDIGWNRYRSAGIEWYSNE